MYEAKVCYKNSEDSFLYSFSLTPKFSPRLVVNSAVGGVCHAIRKILLQTRSKQVETWCVVDKKLICFVCIAEDHHGHKCENLQSAAESARKEISSSCDSARQMLAKTVACKAAIENSTARVEEACAAEEKKIRLRFQEVRAHEVWKSVRCILLYLFNFLFYDYNCNYYYFYYDYCYYDYLF
jgi:hypothetical protein